MTEANGTTTITMNGTRKCRLYVAGPMRTIPMYNFPAFDAHRDHLTALGWNVVSPADIDRACGFDPATLSPEFDWDTLPSSLCIEDILLRDVEALATCDAIYLMHGWEDSSGSQRELAEARKLGLREFYEDVCASPSPSVMMADGEVSGDIIDATLCGPCEAPFDISARAVEEHKKRVNDGVDEFVREWTNAAAEEWNRERHENVTRKLAPAETRITDALTERDSVLDEAKRLVSGERDRTYGKPTDHFAHVAALMNELWKKKFKDGEGLDPHDVAWFQIMVKASRGQNAPKRDNWVDVAGYAACGAECEKREVAT